MLLNPTARAGLEQALREMAERAARESDVLVETEVREGRTVSEILGLAGGLPADLLVIGTHGRSGFERWLLGSVTEKVMRKAPCPVLTVPPPSETLHPRGSSLFQRILCPVDFPETSRHALRYALSLAQESRTELVVLHALEWPVEQQLAMPPWFEMEEYRRRLEDDARTRLSAAVPLEARVWCRTEEVIASGKAGREILRTAEERRSDLIVMGVRGRNPIDLAVFGSTTQHVVRGAGCPVLVVHTD
jgi:nucleotide-binding universal stress UspA family protein